MATTGGDEVQSERELTEWRRSSRCESNACVEVAVTVDRVMIRDSNGPGVILTFAEDEWNAFLLGVLAGEFDIDELGA